MVLDDSGEIVRGAFDVDEADPLFQDDMESGTNGWAATGLWHRTASGAESHSEARSPITSWWFGDEASGSYAPSAGSAGDLVSPEVSLPETGGLLSFFSWG